MAKSAALVSPATFDDLLRAVRSALVQGQALADRAYLLSYHTTGRLIDAHLLLNKDRAAYGAKLFSRLADALNTNDRLLYRCLRFYRTYPNLTGRSELVWAHYRVLVEVADKRQRDALEREVRSKRLTSVQLEERVRALNASIEDEDAPVPTRNVTPPKLLTPRRGTPGVCRVLADGAGVAVDLGFSCYLTLSGNRHGAGDFVRVAADGVAAVTGASKADLFTYRAEVIKVVDGDTLWVKIFLRPDQWVKEKLRLRDLDCPELNTSEGKAAQRFTLGLLVRAKEVVVTTSKPDKYDRYLADVFARGDDGGEIFLNNELLAHGHAVVKREWEFKDWGEEGA